ncbi:MAG TPA: hypothetical protein DDZ53_07845 [Firmicutes bacterium]|nr:hypothetical protein [Bacillota bacterium]
MARLRKKKLHIDSVEAYACVCIWSPCVCHCGCACKCTIEEDQAEGEEKGREYGQGVIDSRRLNVAEVSSMQYTPPA